jgi:hypothetical protein
VNDRRIFDGLIYLARTGGQWCALPWDSHVCIHLTPKSVRFIKNMGFFDPTTSSRLSTLVYSVLALRYLCKNFRSDPLYLWASTKGGRENPSSRRLIIRCSSPSRPQAQLRTMPIFN